MRYSTTLSHAVRIMVFIALFEGMALTSGRTAMSIHTNPSSVRQLMSRLKAAGLIRSVTGHPRPELARDPAAISLLALC